MYEALVNDGISENRITKEDKSSSTYENLLFSKQILEDGGKPLRIAIVTDGFHQWRARRKPKVWAMTLNASVPLHRGILFLFTGYGNGLR